MLCGGVIAVFTFEGKPHPRWRGWFGVSHLVKEAMGLGPASLLENPAHVLEIVHLSDCSCHMVNK